MSLFPHFLQSTYERICFTVCLSHFIESLIALEALRANPVAAITSKSLSSFQYTAFGYSLNLAKIQKHPIRREKLFLGEI
ncbi:MAG: hypothetical protein KME64_36150 [Scytonematopsis contorta HA4267-MV1]|nr:hypothetical protein [Scytonematopsis contorta HA4267-MV1]